MVHRVTASDNEWQRVVQWVTANGNEWQWVALTCVLKRIYFLYKNVMLQVDPFKSSCSQKQQYPERTLSLKVYRKSSSLEKVILASAIFYNCSFEIFTILYEKLQLLLRNCQINRKYLFQKSPLQVEMSTIALLKDLLNLTLDTALCLKLFEKVKLISLCWFTMKEWDLY